MVRIKIIMGSVRPNRFNPQPSHWIYEIAKQREDIDVELIDLKEVNLPFLDEPEPPSGNNYTHEHSKAWSKRIDEADGFIFVTPEYNHSYSPVLKNAIDFLFREWHYKPVAFVSYGAHAGGARAVEHLRPICAQLRMYVLREQLAFASYEKDLDENGNYKFTEKQVALASKLIDALTFWAGEMQVSRGKLLK